MKPPIILTAGMTRLSALQDRFENLGCFRMSRYGTEWDEPDAAFLLDASFDIYDPALQAEFLYERFAEVQPTLRSLSKLDKRLYVVRDYPLSTADKRLSYLSHVIDRFTEGTGAFFGAKMIYIPLVVSRSSLNRLKDPVTSVISAVRAGKALRVPFQENSRVTVIYDQDLLQSLLEVAESEDVQDRIVEGNVLTLADASRIVQAVAGDAPIQFDKKDFVNYRYPDDTVRAVGQVNYGLENMMIDLIDRLF